MVRVGVDVDAGVGAGVGAVEVFTLYVTPCLFTHWKLETHKCSTSNVQIYTDQMHRAGALLDIVALA